MRPAVGLASSRPGQGDPRLLKTSGFRLFPESQAMVSFDLCVTVKIDLNINEK
jgi:hypothetical protein